VRRPGGRGRARASPRAAWLLRACCCSTA
jgi:hypothetical protein